MADDKMSMLEEDEPKIKVEELYIIVEMIDSKNRPYFAILYKEVGANNRNIGYASYMLDVVVEYKNKYFEKV
jgi:hypothetical protein